MIWLCKMWWFYDGLFIRLPVSMGTEMVSHGERRRQVAVIGSSPDFILARELRVLQGKFLPASDVERGTHVAVIGQMVARELFPWQQALGWVIRVGEWRMRVIGVLAEIVTQLGMKMDEVAIVPVAKGMKMFHLKIPR